jgi:hypothetical protein
VPGFAAVLAHQGGWDEALMVALPLGLFAALLRVATLRADRQAAPDHPPRAHDGSDDEG